MIRKNRNSFPRLFFWVHPFQRLVHIIAKWNWIKGDFNRKRKSLLLAKNDNSETFLYQIPHEMIILPFSYCKNYNTSQIYLLLFSSSSLLLLFSFASLIPSTKIVKNPTRFNSFFLSIVWQYFFSSTFAFSIKNDCLDGQRD